MFIHRLALYGFLVWSEPIVSLTIYKHVNSGGITTYSDTKKQGGDVTTLEKTSGFTTISNRYHKAKKTLYALPWVGGPFRVTQGPHGKYSHFTAKSRYAFDIAMPQGTPIVAARSGLVIDTDDGHLKSNKNPSGNFVRILHKDDAMSVYLHLLKGSLKVKKGDRVVAGQIIALSGNSGRSSGPHLHFVVQRNIGSEVKSVAFKFNQPVESVAFHAALID